MKKDERNLNDVIAKNVCHETLGVWQNLVEDDLLVLFRSALQILLYEPEQGLIFATKALIYRLFNYSVE